MSKLITLEEFRAAAKAGERPQGTVVRIASGTPVAVEGAERTVRFVFSDGSVDRAGDTIDPKGWELDGFGKNSVALWAHDSFGPPIGRAANVGVVGARLMGDIEFAPSETYAFADTIYRLVKGGYINACSVGFLALEWTFVNEKDRPYGIDFKRQELIEISVCPVPCNANALVEARSKGIDTRPLIVWAEHVLDGEGKVPIARAEMEALRKNAGAPSRRYWVQSSRTLTMEMVKHIKAGVEAWLTDPTKVLVLDQGLELRSEGADWKCGAARDLAVDESDDWDGAAAEASIFAHAGGDDLDPAIARKGFLLYDASAPKLRGSYKEPFAHVVDGELKAVKGGIHAAASRLPQSDASQPAKDEARAVLDTYEKRVEDAKANGGDRPANVRSGRRISAKNKALLDKAMEHHVAASKCIKDVLDDPDPDPEDDPDDGPGEDEAAAVVTLPDDTDPEAQRRARLAEAKRLRDAVAPQ